jgi:hypothetical protein
VKRGIQTHRGAEKEDKAVSTHGRIMAEVFTWRVAGSREARVAVTRDRDEGLFRDGSKEVKIGGR